ncbi:hypothetical protein WJ972_16570 [Achromobacter insuavis]
MSAQTCIQTSPAFGAACPAPKRAHMPDVSSSAAPAVPVSQPAARNLEAPVSGANRAAVPPGGFIVRLWRAYRQRRADRILRNLADEMDVHMLKDVGAPEWLVNQATVEQSLKRVTRIDSLRW